MCSPSLSAALPLCLATTFLSSCVSFDEEAPALTAADFAVSQGSRAESDSAVGSLLFIPQNERGSRTMVGICSGTLIAPRILLTARHCVDPRYGMEHHQDGLQEHEATDLFVAWDADVTSNAIISRAVGHKFHDTFDLALVELESVPEGIEPVPVNGRPLEARYSGEGRLIGFGITSFQRDDSGERRTGTVNVRDQVDWPRMGEMLLIENTTGNQMCPGDSGGPTLMNFPEGDAVVGVSSFILGPCELAGSLGFSVPTHVHIEWIQDTVAAFGSEPPTILFNAENEEATTESGGCQAGGSSSGWLLMIGLTMLWWRRRPRGSVHA